MPSMKTDEMMLRTRLSEAIEDAEHGQYAASPHRNWPAAKALSEHFVELALSYLSLMAIEP
jgi:hypothetical protein